MDTKIISVRVAESALRDAETLQQHYGLSRSRLIAFLLESGVKQLELSRDKGRLSILASDRKA
jgi:antitoxin component of RelBE/YafQ-DinJ toxin-antitoxin module